MANSAVVGVLRVLLSASTAEFETATKRAAESAKLWSRDLKQVGAQAQQVGLALTKHLTVPLLGLTGIAVKTASDFESSFAGVRKTVAATEAEFAMLSSGFRAMAKAIPLSVNELNRIGEAAGQLGIRTENILGFSRVMADLGVTTNLSSDQAATALARLANITGMPQTEFDRLGSTIVALGNNFATTESEVVDFGLRIAGAGTLAGMTEPQILAIGAAMSSIGVEAEAGGTAVQKVINQMTEAVATGNADLSTFADTAGMSAAAFAAAFRDDAAGAFGAFVAGLGEQGDRAFGTLDALKLGNERVVRAFLGLANAGDLLTQSLATGTQAWDENTALAVEAAQRYETFESQLQLLRNELTDVAIDVGTALLPALRAGIDVAKSFVPVVATLAAAFADLPAPVKAAVVGVVGLSAVIGPALWAFGSLTGAAATLIGTFTSKGIAMRALTTTAGVLTTATSLQAAEALALATSWDRVRGAILAAAAATKTGIVAMLPGAGAVALVGGAAAGVAVLGSKLSELGGISDQTNQRLSRMNYTLGEGRIKTEAAAESLPKVTGAFEALAKRGVIPAVDAMAYLGREAELLGNTIDRLPTTDAATQTALWRQELADAGREVSTLTTEQRQAIDVGTKLGKSTKEMAEALGLSELAITRHSEGVKAAAEAQKKWLESIEYVGARMTWFATGPGTWVSRANWELKGSVEDAGAALHDLVFDTDIATRAWGALPKPIADSRDAIRGVRDEIEARSWMTAFTRWLEGIPMLVRDAFTGGGGLGGALRAAVSTFGSMGIGKLFELNLEDGKVVGGGAIGKALANVLPSSMASMIPGLGAAIGSLAGPAVKAIAGLFTDKHKQEVQAYNGEIRKLQESFFATHGPIEQSERLARALGMTIQGELGHQGKAGLEATKRVFEEFEGRLGRVREEMARLSKDGGLASDELIRFRDAMRDSAEVVEFVRQQTTAGAASIKAFLDATTLSTQEGATAAAAVILAAWDGTTAGLQQLTPTIDALRRQLEETGFTGGAAFEEIAHLAGIVADETAGPMLSGISAATGAISAMHNAGLLTDEMFQGLSLEVVALRDQLLAQGHDAGHVHRLMQKDLQVLWELTTDHGMAIDETTQAMLDEAEASGIVGDKFRSSTDRMIAAVERMADVIEDAFGRKLPAAAEAGAAAAGRAIDGLASRHVSIPVDFVPSVAGFDFGGMEIPIRAMADGGIAMRTIFAAGEAGPEVIAPLSKLPELLPDRGGDAALFPALQREIRGLRHAMERQVDELRYALKDTVLQGIG